MRNMIELAELVRVNGLDKTIEAIKAMPKAQQQMLALQLGCEVTSLTVTVVALFAKASALKLVLGLGAVGFIGGIGAFAIGKMNETPALIKA